MRLAIFHLLAIGLGFVGYLSAKSLGQRTVLGILEDNPGHYAGEANFRTVRAVFSKADGLDWKALPSNCSNQACLKEIAAKFPHNVTWTIAFDGKSVGTVATRSPQEFEWYAGVGQQQIISKGSVPTVGERSTEFAGWLDSPVYRPLVAVSRPYFKDPESWKPAHFPDYLEVLLRKQFRNKFPEVTNCDNPEENILKPWRYLDEDIKITKAYSARNGWFVVSLRLAEYRCDGPWEGADDPFSSRSFAISPGREVKFLGEGMWLVDAGDYDNDGKSELVFSIDRYNRGGYELFYDEFTKHVTFEYSYH